MKTKYNRFPFSFLLLAGLIYSFLFFPGFLTASQPDFLQLKGQIIIGPNEIQDSIVAFSSRVEVNGKVKDDVVVFGGEIVINGEVGGSVLGLGSKVKITPTAKLGKDLIVLGSSLEKEPGCLIKGDTIYFPTSGLLFKEIFKKGIFFPVGTLFLGIKLVSLFFTILLTIFVAGIFPRQINFAALRIREDFWPVLGTGFLAMIIYSGLIVLSVILFFIIIGIPLFFILLFIGLVLKVFGGTAVSFFFGESFLRAFGVKKMPELIWTAIIGLLIVFFIGLFPVIGLIFSMIISLIGWGVALRTRFGTMNNWFRENKI